YHEGGMYGYAVPPERVVSDEARNVTDMLARIVALSDQPLAVARPLPERLVGCCRDYSLLLAAMLRHHGIPARVRFGFSRYFASDFGHDHVVTEYWNRQHERWMLIDAQQDELHIQTNRLAFDPHDIPHDQFPFAGVVWQQARTGALDPERYGYDRSLRGWWVIQQYLVHDLAALNKMELLIGDSWGLCGIAPGETADAQQTAVLDEAAGLTLAADTAFERMRAFYEHTPGLRVPPSINSYSLGDQWREHIAIADD
ncbi:MAG TPA: transglutaminase-like domain-containing protein, partial [Roseiflexaceae bacterium]|nr:transglutaminase-like domain-containing protein [Roseiflexaceae bacterium]